MLNPDLYYNARWQDLYQFLADGNPPLVLRLMAINTLFFVVFVVRRARAKHSLRSHTAYFVQALLIGANAFLMFGQSLMQSSHLTRYIL